jgi:hypothetical protein
MKEFWGGAETLRPLFQEKYKLGMEGCRGEHRANKVIPSLGRAAKHIAAWAPPSDGRTIEARPLSDQERCSQ